MAYTELGDPAFLARTTDDAAAIAAVLRREGGSAEVAHCPGWAVRDVVAHLGDVHRWATEIVRTGQLADDGLVAPGSDEALADWFEDGAAELVAVLGRTEPSTPCWTFGLPPGVAGFWRRRQSLETAVHRFDVEHAVGMAPSIAGDLAVAGITEVVEMFYPRQVLLGRTPAPDFVITLCAKDPSGASTRWQIGTTGPRAELTGTAEDLLLVLWKRPHPDVSRSGDPGALAAFAAAAVTP